MKKAKAKANANANAKAKVTYAPFEVADYLDSEEAIAEYLSLAARDENPGVLLKALGDVAKARGVAVTCEYSPHHLFLAAGEARWHLLLIPLLWCAISGLTLWTMEQPEAPVAPILAAAMAVLAAGKTLAHRTGVE